MSGLDGADIQCMACFESLHQPKNVFTHRTQNKDVENLMRAAGDVDFPGSEALRDLKLQAQVRPSRSSTQTNESLKIRKLTYRI